MFPIFPHVMDIFEFRVGVIWVSITLSTFQKWLEILWSIWLFDNLLSTYGNLFFVAKDS